MSNRGTTTGRRDINKAGGEDAEFPILCETCLGPNPYVRMTKQPLGAECKICTRPFTVFRWQPGSTARFKKTEVCQTCAKSRNVCQTCLLDLQFGLPTQVRDTALGVVQKAPTSAINREYHAQNIESSLEDGVTSSGASSSGGAVNFGRADPAAREMLKKLARQDPNYNRNRPKLCSFFAKGECNRGDACPYRHEMPKEGQIGGNSIQNMRDRFHGTNDAVARKMLSSAASSSGLAPPSDETITSLYLTSVPSESNTDSALRAYLLPLLSSSSSSSNGNGSSGHGIKSVVPVLTTNCAFVNFANREEAEEVAGKLALRNIGNDSKGGVKVSIGEGEMGVQWGRKGKKKIVQQMADKEKQQQQQGQGQETAVEA